MAYQLLLPIFLHLHDDQEGDSWAGCTGWDQSSLHHWWLVETCVPLPRCNCLGIIHDGAYSSPPSWGICCQRLPRRALKMVH